MRLTLHRSTINSAIFLLLTFSILWRGGKALDATWVLSLSACAVTLLSIFFVQRDEKSIAPLVPWLLAFLFLLWTILSFLFSETKNYGFDELLQTASLFLLFQFALSLRESELPHFRSRFARVIACSALIACGIGMIVYTLQPVSRFVGTFLDVRFSTDYWPNAWAEFLLFVWPLTLWSLFGRTGERSRLLKILVMGFLLSCLLLSYSRGGLLVFFIQILLCSALWLLRCRTKLQSKMIVNTALSILLVALVFFLASNTLRSRFHAVESVSRKVTFTSAEGTSSVSERSQFWRQALFFIQQKPLFGFGPYSFRFLQPHLQTNVLATSDHPHHVFLKFAMERGVVAAILFAFLIVYCLRSVWKIENGPHFASDGAPKGRKWAVESDDGLRTLMLVSITGVLLHNLIDYNLQFVGIALPLWLGLGLIVPRVASDKDCRYSLQKFFSVLIALLLLLFTLIEGRFLVLSSFARREENSGNDLAAMLWYSETDASVFPRDAWLSRARIHLSNDKPEDAQEAIAHAMTLNAADYRIWKLQGDLFLRIGKTGDALDAFETAYRFGRYNDLGITRVLVELLRSDKSVLDSRRHEFELLMNDFGLAIQENTHFIALSSNVEEMTKLTDLLSQIYPSEASLYRELERRSREHAAFERARLSARPRGLLW